MYKIPYFFVALLSFFFLLNGCTHQEKLSKTLQSTGATQLKHDFKKINEHLLTYKEKLDSRNPTAFSKTSKMTITYEISQERNTLSITYNGKKLKTYDDYLRVAFDTSANVPERNDFLIIGLHKLICETYQIDKGHQFTTLSYQQEAFKKLYYYLEVIKWKIRTTKDKEGNYLFITWQNNWQIELEQKLKQGAIPSWEMLQNLPSIQQKRETLLDASNPNFEIILNHMIAHVKNSARIVGDEPVDVGISAMLSLVFFL
jgi:hypothetical protein